MSKSPFCIWYGYPNETGESVLDSIADPVTGDADLDARGLVTFDEDFLSSTAGELLRDGEGLAEPDPLPEIIPAPGKPSEAPSS